MAYLWGALLHWEAYQRTKRLCEEEVAYADKEREITAAKALPIGNVNSRVLLMAGEKDSSWPSAYSVSMLPLKKDVMKQVDMFILHHLAETVVLLSHS